MDTAPRTDLSNLKFTSVKQVDAVIAALKAEREMISVTKLRRGDHVELTKEAIDILVRLYRRLKWDQTTGIVVGPGKASHCIMVKITGLKKPRSFTAEYWTLARCIIEVANSSTAVKPTYRRCPFKGGHGISGLLCKKHSRVRP